MKSYVKGILVGISIVVVSFSFAQEKEDLDFKALRDEQIKKWGVAEVPDINAITDRAKNFLSLPINQQTVKQLEEIAEETNRAANFINFIYIEYKNYYSDMYRYEFVQEKVAPYHDEYVEISNKLKGFRNQSYYNLGIKFKAEGNNMAAFFYFRDAFRLSSFTEPDGDNKGLRYESEIQMKELMGIEGVGTFIYWQ